MVSKNINFFDVLADERKPVVNKKAMSGYVVLVLVVVINVGIMGAFLMSNRSFVRDIDEVKAFLDSAYVAKAVTLQKELGKNIEIAQNDIETYNKFILGDVRANGFNSQMYMKIVDVKPENLSILSFSFENDIFVLNCITQNGNTAADFTKALELTGDYEYVTYKGFNESVDGVNFPITCKIKAVGGEDE